MCQVWILYKKSSDRNIGALKMRCFNAHKLARGTTQLTLNPIRVTVRALREAGGNLSPRPGLPRQSKITSCNLFWMLINSEMLSCDVRKIL